jgi:two-component system CheB/CheR fusion protein
MFAEALSVGECSDRVKIYGTDVDDEALHAARAGVYSPSVLEPLSAEMRDKYFENLGSNYAFRSDLRRRVIFGRHDITRDAPISRLHLLVCRNTLMYFNVEAQSQIVDRFHFALRPNGYLFLGKAEMLLANSDRFELTNMRQRIFRRQPGAAAPPHQPPRMTLEAIPRHEVRETGRDRLLRDLVIEFSPNAMISIDSDGRVLQINN